MRLYKIETEFSSVEEIFKTINLETRTAIDALETNALKKQDISIEYRTVENNFLVTYIFANWKGLKVLKTIVSLVGIANVSLKEVTNDVLLYGIEIPETDPFYVLYKKFMLENLSVDTVLDNINKKGIEKLTPLENVVLNAR